MADDPDTDLVLGFIQNRQSEEAESYLKRGRRYKDAEGGLLKERWVELHRELFNFNDENRTEREDVNAEIELRGEQLPFDIVKDEFDAFANKVSLMLEYKKLTDPEGLSESGSELAEEIDQFRRMRDGSAH